MIKYNYAAIDVGSNSINLLLAKVEGKKIVEQVTESYITELGKGLAITGAFSSKGIENAYQTFSKINELLQIHDISKKHVVCVATEASRVAKNSKIFFNRIENEFSITTKIISPEEEASFSIAGVIDSDSVETLVMDLGGASTEIIYVKDGKISQFESFKIGSVNLGDPLFENKIELFIQKIGFKEKVILAGGTAATVAASILGFKEFNPIAVNKLIVNLDEIIEFNRRIQSLQPDQIIDQYPWMKSRINSIQMGLSRMVGMLEIIQPINILFSAGGVRQGALINFIG